MKHALLLLLAACGDNEAPPPDAGIPAPPACTATYTGNVTGTATTPDACVTVTGTTLTATIPSQQLDAPLVATIELGTAALAGTYASATVATWSAAGTRTVGHHACTYSAGSAVSPHGDFTLVLAATVHGTLALDTAVLADIFTDCGDPIEQTVVLAF